MNSHIEPGIDSDKKIDINTLEIANLYEKQGYYEDAHKIYAALDAAQSTMETLDGLERTREYEIVPPKKTHNPKEMEIHGEQKVYGLLEEWFNLLVTKHRLENFRKLKSRVA